MKRDSIKKDVAIIGISCKFSKTENPKEFWENLKAGVDMNQFYTDDELEKLGIESDKLNDPNFIKLKTKLEDVDKFDFSFFGYTKDEANLMDPQIRLLHEQVWKALEDAGCNPYESKEKIGLYLSANDHFNWIAHSMIVQNDNVDPFYKAKIINKNFISTLISYNLNLNGPSYVIDTACSSTLSALHIACRNLLLKECSIAVTGGVNLSTSNDIGYFYKEGMIYSKDGHCRTFDKDSSGTVGAEGSGIVVLKRLEDALNDRDNIYAVIRSSATNNDGNRKVGFTAPSITGQAECIKMALRFANVDSKTISYIEAHGTGTKLGDPIEIEALNNAFNHDKSTHCAIGSLKSTLGHLDTAAGIAGLIKTTLALKYKMIPASLHFKEANPEINFIGGPFKVNTKLTDWIRNDLHPLRAGVSSFGIGGTNAHVILEEFENPEEGSKSRPFQMISFSAKSQNSLSEYTKKLKEFVIEENFNLADLAYTLNVGRESFSYKQYIICDSKEELLGSLNQLHNNSNGILYKKNKKIVFLFPGQGCQYYKMGFDLYQTEPYFKELINQGAKILLNLTGIDYLKILGYESFENQSKDIINDTQFTQPILFLLEYSLSKLLMKWGVIPSITIGHSLGEYVSACIAEVFSFEDALKIIAKRALLMSKVEKGNMLAVSMSSKNVIDYLTSDLSIAAINSDDSCVVSGNTNSIEALIEVLNANEISSSKLKTSHAFHSVMMDQILDEFEEQLKNIKFSNPKVPFISNLYGRKIKEDEATSKEYWLEHLRNTVNFKGGIDYILQNGESLFIEVGPGKTLLSFLKQNKLFSNNNSTIQLVRHTNEVINDSRKLVGSIAELWQKGVNIDWKAFYFDESRHKISAPTYCFDKSKLDFIVDPLLYLRKNGIDNSQLKHWFYIPNWKKSFISKKTENNNNNKNKNYLIFSEKGALIDSVINQLKNEGKSLIIVEKGTLFENKDENYFKLNPSSESDFKFLFSSIEERGIDLDQIIFNWNFDHYCQKSILYTFNVINVLSKNLIAHFPAKNKKITVINNLNQTVLGDETNNINMLTSIKQFYVLSQENPNIFSCSIDINQYIINNEILIQLIDELKYNYSDHSIAYRNSIRWNEFYEKIEVEEESKSFVKNDKLYLITGGLGKIGRLLTDYLTTKYNAKVIVIGRKEFPPENLWESILNNNNDDYDKEIIDSIKYFQKRKNENVPVNYYATDVSNYDLFSKTINDIIEKEHGKIAGVIHAAGCIDPKTFKPIENLNEEIALKQFMPKIDGTLNIYKIFKDKSLDFVWITSSLASVLGGLTFGAYTVANAFIDNFCISKRKELKNWFTINLDGINEGGINHQKLLKVFEKSFITNVSPQIIVSIKDPNTFKLKQSEYIEGLETSDNDRIIDRNILGIDYVEPTSKIEEELCEMIESFFGYEKIGVLDNFFEMGGDSLKAMTLMKRINKSFSIDMNIEDFYKNPCIKELSNEIELAVRAINLQHRVKGEKTIVI